MKKKWASTKKDIQKKETSIKGNLGYILLIWLETKKRKSGVNYESDIQRLEEELKKLKSLMADQNDLHDQAKEKQKAKGKDTNTRKNRR